MRVDEGGGKRCWLVRYAILKSGCAKKEVKTKRKKEVMHRKPAIQEYGCPIKSCYIKMDRRSRHIERRVLDLFPAPRFSSEKLL